MHRGTFDFLRSGVAGCRLALVTPLALLLWRTFTTTACTVRNLIRRPHVGTTDVDLVIALALSDEGPEAYRTLENNLRKAKFSDETSFRWNRNVDGINVTVEFFCETDKVEPGRIFKPKQGVGSGLGAFNVPGAQLVARDFSEVPCSRTWASVSRPRNRNRCRRRSRTRASTSKHRL